MSLFLSKAKHTAASGAHGLMHYDAMWRIQVRSVPRSKLEMAGTLRRMPELLVELGCEELPATAVRKAYSDLAAAIEAELTEAGIGFRPGHRPIGTPRRLIVHFEDVEPRQPDRRKEARGPALSAAYDAGGQPTKALEGFCRGQGATLDDVQQRDGYVWIDKLVPGQDTREWLAEMLPRAIMGLAFEKSMRWGEGRMRFARPIRWILAAFDGELVPFDLQGVRSGLHSQGHRFYAPEAFEARSLSALLDGLIARKVEPDPLEREKTIREVAIRMASGMPDLDDRLVDENVFLTEWPTPIEGVFSPAYLELPEPVLVTAMAKHEKMFPVRDDGGRLKNTFVFVRNSGEDATVRAGAEWVLNARFNDAKFFFDEDRKQTLEEFLAKTSAIVFQEKLGTVRARADRLAAGCGWLATVQGATADETERSQQAGRLAKADLASGLVGEMASLQGIVGGEYGRMEGLPEVVCAAIAAQYDLNAVLRLEAEAQRLAARLMAADQFDKLAGYLGIGAAPSGSSDPFGLRRAATLLIEIAWQVFDLDLAAGLNQAVSAYREQGVEADPNAVVAVAREIIVGRYESLLEEYRYDLVQAAILDARPDGPTRPNAVRRRLEVLQLMAGDSAFVQAATRPINIVKAARDKGIAFALPGSNETIDPAALNAPAGEALGAALDAFDAAPKDTPHAMQTALKQLEAPIHGFFETTMVMSEQPQERQARLSLAQRAADALLLAGDWTKLVLDGA